ncbi:hypothetical protein B296_00046323 [Ensete ventricosum]|uniref:Uncharacterized protein n=1 Tax=Ensete ventricosum TaxID=4639 RepID=A0A426X7F3_ENSVE|nr:hypothetical protein B296_00046323 [Ensete ventricosum]
MPGNWPTYPWYALFDLLHILMSTRSAKISFALRSMNASRSSGVTPSYMALNQSCSFTITSIIYTCTWSHSGVLAFSGNSPEKSSLWRIWWKVSVDMPSFSFSSSNSAVMLQSQSVENLI